mmetsp:Transcript_5301/g.13511  ORF Transcript_5301/g.13511 Transcript_5301/m.13511 type:complete len:212 (-) Transcript_5301:159-794(-)
MVLTCGGLAVLTSRLQTMTRIPKAFALLATSMPMSPLPRTPRVSVSSMRYDFCATPPRTPHSLRACFASFSLYLRSSASTCSITYSAMAGPNTPASRVTWYGRGCVRLRRSASQPAYVDCSHFRLAAVACRDANVGGSAITTSAAASSDESASTSAQLCRVNEASSPHLACSSGNSPSISLSTSTFVAAISPGVLYVASQSVDEAEYTRGS